MLKERLRQSKIMQVWPDQNIPWEERKKEIVNMVLSEEYGRIEREEDSLTFETQFRYDEFAAGKAVYSKVKLTAAFGSDKYSWDLTVMVPKALKPVPFFVYISFSDFPECPLLNSLLPAEEIIDRGYGLLIYNYQSLVLDYDWQKHNSTNFSLGVYPYLFPSRKSGEPTYNHIAVWAWGARKALDYAETDERLDMNRAAVVGHSRLGKTALVAGMLDERFSSIIMNDSGCGGAGLYRAISDQGEKWDDVARVFPYWMDQKYQAYVGKIDELPFDQHFAIAACAPRKVYVSARSEDLWSDPNAMFLCCKAASEVYDKLGLPGLIAEDRLPAEGDVCPEGNIGFHLLKGPHCLGREDWRLFMDFLDK